MKHTKEEILNALKIIKEECYHAACKECPFGERDGGCLTQDHVPESWSIEDEEPEQVWRAFK